MDSSLSLLCQALSAHHETTCLVYRKPRAAVAWQRTHWKGGKEKRPTQCAHTYMHTCTTAAVHTTHEYIQATCTHTDTMHVYTHTSPCTHTYTTASVYTTEYTQTTQIQHTCTTNTHTHTSIYSNTCTHHTHKYTQTTYADNTHTSHMCTLSTSTQLHA